MQDCKSVETSVKRNLKLIKAENEKLVYATLFKQVVGSLRYICNSRPNITFGVGLVSRFMNDSKVSHIISPKRIMRYLKGTQSFGLVIGIPKIKRKKSW